MKSAILEEAIAYLPCERGDFALIHEAAVLSWDLDYSLFPYAIDVLVSDVAFLRLSEAGGAVLHVWNEDAYLLLPWEADIPLRCWQSVRETRFETTDRIRNEKYGVECLVPAVVLELLPYSPNYPFLKEQRARLAEVLYFDEMSDEELAEFHKYVRGD